MTPNERSRGEAIARFRERAAEKFEAQPELRSAVLAVAQYFADGAWDEVHDIIVVSPREVPLWPPFCEGYRDEREPTNAEWCTAGWHERANLLELEQLALALPRELQLSLVPSPYWAPLAFDAERIAYERQTSEVRTPPRWGAP